MAWRNIYEACRRTCRWSSEEDYRADPRCQQCRESGKPAKVPPTLLECLIVLAIVLWVVTWLWALAHGGTPRFHP